MYLISETLVHRCFSKWFGCNFKLFGNLVGLKGFRIPALYWLYTFNTSLVLNIINKISFNLSKVSILCLQATDKNSLTVILLRDEFSHGILSNSLIIKWTVKQIIILKPEKSAEIHILQNVVKQLQVTNRSKTFKQHSLKIVQRTPTNTIHPKNLP